MPVIESPIFPYCVSFGVRFGPAFDTDIVETDGGQEWRTINRSQPKQRGTVSLRVARDERMAVIRQWIYVAQGRARAFRIRDSLDYRVPDNSGQGVGTLVSGVDSTAGAVYQLEKWYARGSEVFKRKITKPTVGATKLYAGATLKALTTDYLLDESTGKITLVTNFAPTSWAGTFEILVRFDVDEHEFEALDKHAGAGDFIQGFDEVPVVEVLFP